MTRKDDGRHRLRRRDLLRTVGAGTALLGLPAYAAQTDGSDRSFVVEQGGSCYEVEPLGDGSQTVESFYDWGLASLSYSSDGTVALQRADTSLVFLYRGSNGLSLVFIHGKNGGDGDGGSVSATISDLPGTVEWAVQDDYYEGDTNYDTWSGSGDTRQVDWTWGSGNTDGGALRGLDDTFEVSVEMAFNEQAALYGDPYEGHVEEWQLLSGSVDDPDRTALALDEPLTVRTGSCERVVAPSAPGEPTSRPEPLELVVDVKPGSERTPVNPSSRGRLPVAVYSERGADATVLDVGTVTLDPGGAAPVAASTEDVDGDGRVDLLVNFDVQDLELGGQETTVELTAETSAGTTVTGSDAVTVVPPSKGDDEPKRNGQRGDEESRRERESEAGEDEPEGESERGDGRDAEGDDEREDSGDDDDEEDGEDEREGVDGDEADDADDDDDEDDENDDDDEDDEDEENEREDDDKEENEDDDADDDDADDDDADDDEDEEGDSRRSRRREEKRGRENGRGRANESGRESTGRGRAGPLDEVLGRGNGLGGD